MKQPENIAFINQFWDKYITPTLMEYIKIPNKSPSYDNNWREHGHMAKAVTLIADWCRKHATPNMTIDIIQLENKTPVILIDVPGNNTDTLLLYGHLDKQPEMTGWDSDLHPWKPVLRGDRLYGRGSADDGYAVFSCLAAINSLHQQNIPHAHCIILIECCEESGSADLPFYMEKLKEKLGNPSLVICLDSGCGNYDQMWITTSLRGLAEGQLSIDVLNKGIHSGIGGGVVPSVFRILRQLLNRIEDEKTGDIKLKELQVKIPEDRQQQAIHTAEVLEKSYVTDLPFVHGVLPESSSVADLIIRNTWKASLAVTGCDGLPLIQNAGNVILPRLAVKLSLRLPPTSDAKKISKLLKDILEKDPPYQAHVEFTSPDSWEGWNAPKSAPWLLQTFNRASQTYFGKDVVYMGEGASIPFMGMLGKTFPQAQFMITGVLGPESNAHGPNEFLHIPTAKKLTACITQVIADHYQRA